MLAWFQSVMEGIIRTVGIGIHGNIFSSIVAEQKPNYEPEQHAHDTPLLRRPTERSHAIKSDTKANGIINPISFAVIEWVHRPYFDPRA